MMNDKLVELAIQSGDKHALSKSAYAYAYAMLTERGKRFVMLYQIGKIYVTREGDDDD